MAAVTSRENALYRPEKYEKRVLFPRLGLPSTLIRHENEALQKRSLSLSNLKTLALRFSVDGKHFEKELFANDDISIIM